MSENENQTCKTRQEVARELGISTKTLLRFIKNQQLSITSYKLLTPDEYRLIKRSFNGNTKQA